MLGKMSADILKYLSYILLEVGFDISCKGSPFPTKHKKKIYM